MLTCLNCAYDSPLGSRFCEACGAALKRGVDDERLADEVEAEFLFMQVKRVRFVLLGVAVLQLVFGSVQAITLGMDAGASAFATVWAVALGVPAVFFFLTWWCQKSPFAAALVGLVVFVTLHGAAAAVDPSTFTQGFVLKGVIIAALIQAMTRGVQFRRFKAERGLR
jgi:hypothetical protein